MMLQNRQSDMAATVTHFKWSENARILSRFGLLTVAAGAFRAVLTLTEVLDDLTRFASMTVVILAGRVFFARRGTEVRERLFISYALVIPYMLIEVPALGYTWWSGRTTIFHTPPYTLGTPIEIHFYGHLLDGLTWEPLVVFLMITLGSTLLRLLPNQK
jgi:hypothetical protein